MKKSDFFVRLALTCLVLLVLDFGAAALIGQATGSQFIHPVCVAIGILLIAVLLFSIIAAVISAIWEKPPNP